MKQLTQSERRLGFRIHAIAAIGGMALLLIINLWTGSPYWIVWVLPAWGIGLLSHWWVTLGPGAGRPGTT
jgi:hypothetical protein